MDNSQLIALANDLMGCYLDDASDGELAQVCDQHGVIIGEPEFCMAVSMAMAWLFSGKI